MHMRGVHGRAIAIDNFQMHTRILNIRTYTTLEFLPSVFGILHVSKFNRRVLFRELWLRRN